MTVCLCAIVKNESAVIRRCLESALPYIDTWSICDTGSTDGTQAIILDCLRDIPGVLHERPWVDQQHNRNESIDLARHRADYLLLIDADEVLEADPGFAMPALAADAYELTVRYGGLEFARAQIVSTRLPWRWVGKRHPVLRADGASAPVLIPGLYTVARSDGASWRDPDKYRKHAAEMEGYVAADPSNPRLRYYLAQSYRDAGDRKAARGSYLLRAEMGGWDEERWSALLEAAKCSEWLGYDPAVVVADYLRAHDARPTRAEALYHVARYLRKIGRPIEALPHARRAAAIPRPPDRLFIERPVYDWRAVFEWCASAGQAVQPEETARAYDELRKRRPELADVAT